MNKLPEKTVNLSWDQAFRAEWNFDSGRYDLAVLCSLKRRMAIKTHSAQKENVKEIRNAFFAGRNLSSGKI